MQASSLLSTMVTPSLPNKQSRLLHGPQRPIKTSLFFSSSLFPFLLPFSSLLHIHSSFQQKKTQPLLLHFHFHHYTFTHTHTLTSTPTSTPHPSQVFNGRTVLQVIQVCLPSSLKPSKPTYTLPQARTKKKALLTRFYFFAAKVNPSSVSLHDRTQENPREPLRLVSSSLTLVWIDKPSLVTPSPSLSSDTQEFPPVETRLSRLLFTLRVDSPTRRKSPLNNNEHTTKKKRSTPTARTNNLPGTSIHFCCRPFTTHTAINQPTTQQQ